MCGAAAVAAGGARCRPGLRPAVLALARDGAPVEAHQDHGQGCCWTGRLKVLGDIASWFLVPCLVPLLHALNLVGSSEAQIICVIFIAFLGSIWFLNLFLELLQLFLLLFICSCELDKYGHF